MVREAAIGVFGVSQGGPTVRGDGRKANPWFKHCRSEWHALQIALRHHDSHAASAARREFNRVKRKFKRYYDRLWQARLLRDYKYNSRRFWTAFQGEKASCSLTDMRAWEDHWKQLFGTSGQHSLPECAPSVQQLKAKLLAERHVPPE